MGIEAIFGVVGAAVSAMGAMQQGRAQAQQMEYQAQVARNNAIIADQNAAQQRNEGAIAAANQSLKTAQVGGAVKAMAAANGLDVNEGSPLDLRTSVYKTGMLDALTIQYNAESRARGSENQGRAQTAQAGAYMAGAANAESAGNLNAFTSMLGSARSFAGKWDSFGSESNPMGGIWT